MTERKHSPLPWGVDCNDYDSSIIKSIGPLSSDNYAGSSWLCFEGDQDENVAFILRAVNTHYELVEALKGLLSQVEEMTKHSPYASLEIEMAKKALAKARGEA